MKPPTHILIADDDRDTADTTADLLQLEGYDTRAVYNGLEAVETARSFDPQVVILDINMPEMDGYEAAASLRRECVRKDLILICVSALSEPQDIEQARRSGFDHHLAKPVNAGKLLALIDSSLVDAALAAPPSNSTP